MKHYWKHIAILSLAALLLASCGGKQTPGEDTSADTALDTSVPETPAISLVTGGATEYTIVREDEGSSADTANAVLLRKYFEACGLKIKITTDWEGNPVSEKEIVVGDTSRLDALGIDPHTVGEEGYIMTTVGERIILVGGTADSTKVAVEAFLTEFFGYAGDAEKANPVTDVTVPAGWGKTVKQEYAITAIRVGDTDLSEYTLIARERAEKKVAEQLQAQFYRTAGVWLPIAEEGEAGKRILMESGKTHKEKTFEVTVESGDLVLRTDVDNGVARGFSRFFRETIANKSGEITLGSDFYYIDEIGTYVTYSEFGAVGDGTTNDFQAIYDAHKYANQHGMKVIADEGATYYIGERSTTAEIQTDVDWTGASFIIDDTKIDLNQRQNHTWHVSRKNTAGIDLKQLGVTSVKAGATSLPVTLESDCYVEIYDDSTKRFIRNGSNQNSGSTQTDCFILRADGTVDPTTPIIWDFNRISKIRAYPLETETLTITGGTITTIANQAESKYNYYTTGIEVMRSNVVIDSLTHYVEGEIDHGAPYDAIIQVNECANVTVQNCTLTAHKIYWTIGSAGKEVRMGSYDLRCRRAINVLFKDCVQTTDIFDENYWGLFCSDYCKNLTLDGCTFSRFDAHMGVTNATIKNSTLGWQCLNAIGHGLLTVENSTLYGDSFINLRSDYGLTWNGDVVIKDCVWIPNQGKGTSTVQCLIGGGDYKGDHYFGYDCYMPQNITIDGLTVKEGKTSGAYKGIYILRDMTPANKNASFSYKYPYEITKTVTVKNFKSDSGKGWKLSTNMYMYRDVAVTDLDG